MNNIEKEWIKIIYNNIIEQVKFPKFGSPETSCDKCMFHKIACFPFRADVVGCYHGWKREKEV